MALIPKAGGMMQYSNWLLLSNQRLKPRSHNTSSPINHHFSTAKQYPLVGLIEFRIEF
jgi:hypothetical protein